MGLGREFIDSNFHHKRQSTGIDNRRKQDADMRDCGSYSLVKQFVRIFDLCGFILRGASRSAMHLE